MNIGNTKYLICGTIIFVIGLFLGALQDEIDPQTNQQEANLKKAVYCMDLLENQKDLVASSRECFAEVYIQHTPWLRDGKEAVLSAFATKYKKYPDFAMEIKRTGADGDLVWLHLHTKRTPDTLGNAVINVFRMKDGKFLEHWNVVQAVAEKSVNDNTMF